MIALETLDPTTIESLQHDLDALAVQLEMNLAARKSASGIADEAFEDWREAFDKAMAHPHDEERFARSQAALDALIALVAPK